MKLAQTAALAATLVLGCGGGTTPGTDAAAGADVGMDAAVSNDASAPDTSLDAGSTIDAALCATTLPPLPVAMYAMIDQSGSMLDPVGGGGSKWDALTQAIDAYLAGPGAGVSFGLQYFGLPATGTCPVACISDADCGACGPCLSSTCIGGLGDSCTSADYAVPDVFIGPASSVASVVHTSLASHTPSTSTPTSAALQGAVDYAGAYAGTHATEYAIAVLITDGDPTECDTSASNIDAIAAAALGGGRHVPTAVLTLGTLPFADGLAVAGGTEAAVTPDLSAAASANIVTALATIAAARCALEIPTGADPTTLMLQSHDGAAVQSLAHRADAAACTTSPGYYLDDPTMPRRVILCPASCTALRASPTMAIERLTSC